MQGIKARIYETFVVMILLVVVVTSIVWVTLGIVNSEYLFGTKDYRGELCCTDSKESKISYLFIGCTHSVIERGWFGVFNPPTPDCYQ